jgi:hypothetical protein
MTPAANPKNTRWTLCLTRVQKRTVAAPSAVIVKVKPVPPAAHKIACSKFSHPFSAQFMRFLARELRQLFEKSWAKTFLMCRWFLVSAAQHTIASASFGNEFAKPPHSGSPSLPF